MRLVRLSCTAVFTAMLYLSALTAVHAQLQIGDSDGDGVDDSIDNCVNVSNPDQADSNGNGIGDACDTVVIVDSDNDGVNDDSDQCPGTETGTTVDDIGCNGTQLVTYLCGTDADYKNHGDYVSCVTKALNRASQEGLINNNEKGGTTSDAAKSDTGKKK